VIGWDKNSPSPATGSCNTERAYLLTTKPLFCYLLFSVCIEHIVVPFSQIAEDCVTDQQRLTLKLLGFKSKIEVKIKGVSDQLVHSSENLQAYNYLNQNALS